MIESSIACVLRRRKGREHPAGVSAPATARSRLAGGLSSVFVPLCYKNARFVSSGRAQADLVPDDLLAHVARSAGSTLR